MKPSIISLIFLTLAFLIGVSSSGTISQNVQLRRIDQAWASLALVGATASDALQDGVPDGWEMQSWGGASRVYRRDSQNALSGNYAVVVERTNAQGVAALAQRIQVMSESHLVMAVSAKGAASAVQFRFRTNGSNDWVARGWQEIEPSDRWRQYNLSVVVPAGTTEAELRLRTSGLTWFDEAYVGIDKDGQLGPNLLQNPGFEQDGLYEDPLEWWQEHVLSTRPLSLSNTVSDRLSVLNIVDMLNGQYDSIKQRAERIGDSCVSAPEMTSWLVGLGPEFEKMGGAAARERVYQLAIQLAPNCPQAYAALAKLYESYGAYWAAVNFYHQAAELAGETAEAGRYYFEEGYLHVKYTGKMDMAVAPLQKAEQLSGWERGTWYQGAASLYLGRALEAESQVVAAIAAYQRVINCSHCRYYHDAAQVRLNNLPTREK